MKLIHNLVIILLLMIFVSISGCASNVGQAPAFSESRQSLALSLEKDKNYADALLQWKILKVVYPYDNNIKQQIERLEATIQQNTKKLQVSLKKAEGKGNKTQVRVINLKILALDPDNIQALKALREIEQEVAFYAASNKTANINNYFKENQMKAQKSILTSKYLVNAKKLQTVADRKKLLTLSNKILTKYPNYEPAVKNKFNVLVSLGKTKIANNDRVAAVALYEQALKLNGIDKKHLLSQTTELKNKLSLKYYKSAMKVFKKDLDKAIKLLQTSLSYNPDNHNANKQLTRATQIMKRLNEIKKMSKSR